MLNTENWTFLFALFHNIYYDTLKLIYEYKIIHRNRYRVNIDDFTH